MIAILQILSYSQQRSEANGQTWLGDGIIPPIVHRRQNLILLQGSQRPASWRYCRSDILRACLAGLAWPYGQRGQERGQDPSIPQWRAHFEDSRLASFPCIWSNLRTLA